MKWNLKILGSSSALPADNRMLSAQLLTTSSHHFLFDCGEGTQFQLRRFKAPVNKIDSIFLTHLHGDHIFGIFGLLSTYSLYRRQKRLTIYAHPGFARVVKSVLRAASVRTVFRIKFVNLNCDGKRLIFEDDELEVYSIPLEHSVPVCGFFVKEKVLLRNVRKDFAREHYIPFYWFDKIKRGEDFVDEDGTVYPNEEITLPEKEAKKFAYFTDTFYVPGIGKEIENVDVLYHEATFGLEHSDDAVSKLHSTSRQAAMVAREANAKRLLIGHFSTRYTDVKFLEEEAKKVFKNTTAVYDGMEIDF